MQDEGFRNIRGLLNIERSAEQNFPANTISKYTIADSYLDKILSGLGRRIGQGKGINGCGNQDVLGTHDLDCQCAVGIVQVCDEIINVSPCKREGVIGKKARVRQSGKYWCVTDTGKGIQLNFEFRIGVFLN